MKTYCFYHNDHDGECSAAIFHSIYQDSITCIPVNYNIPFPFDILKEDDTIYICDFSLQKDGEWNKLKNIVKDTTQIVWIDHHATAIEEAEKLEWVKNLRGIRRTNASGCGLTWEWFYHGDMPLAVKLFQDYDIWTFKYGDDTKNFHAAVSALEDTRPTSEFWYKVLHTGYTKTKKVKKLIKIGKRIRAKEEIINEDILQNWGFEVDFQGYSGIAINRNRTGSLFFKSVADNYDVLLPFIFDGQQYTVSLYATNKSQGIDWGQIAKIYYGGGGHKGAAGFQCDELPFTFKRRLI